MLPDRVFCARMRTKHHDGQPLAAATFRDLHRPHPPLQAQGNADSGRRIRSIRRVRGQRMGLKQRENIQDVLSANGRHKFKWDDYMQYSPMVAAYVLDLTRLEGQHGFKDKTIILAMSYATMGILVNAMKFSVKERRPDSHARNSFPSGHTATVFMGAEFLYREYKDVSPWIGYAGYAVAATTGYLRIYNDRHYFNDVIAGACIGILSTRLSYWLYPKLFKKSRCHTRKDIMAAGLPYCSPEGTGINCCIWF